MAPRKRGSTATSNFGVSKREGHDASAFYSRFETPEFSDLEIIGEPKSLDEIICGSSTNMSDVADNSVALVVTSPPYFAGKAYEEEISLGHVPASYVEYLENLTEVFAECVRTLEPGGRIAVNVANLGRRPYRSLSADVTHILQDRLKLWLRGEIIWVKARGAGGNCAWGSFQQPSNPVLRDLSERIIVASKGRLDRVVRKDRRERDGLPSVSTITRDEFLDYTTDVWEFAPESASRIGHPAPYPIELPARLIDLYTYEGDLVLDPYMGSGTTAVAAVQANRRYIGYDTDANYVERAQQRVAAVVAQLAEESPDGLPRQPALPATIHRMVDEHDLARRAVLTGQKAHDYARDLLTANGFEIVREGVKLAGGVDVSFEAVSLEPAAGRGHWYFDVAGGFSSSKPGLHRTDTLLKAVGTAAIIRAAQVSSGTEAVPLVVLTTEQPAKGTAGVKALAAVVGPGEHTPIRSVITLLDPTDADQVRSLAANG